MNDLVKSISIRGFLEETTGAVFRASGNKFFCKSPFNKDSTWSFCWYPHTNTYYDWSDGHGGSVITLAMRLWGCSAADARAKLQTKSYTQYDEIVAESRKKYKKVQPLTPHEYNVLTTIDDEYILTKVRDYAHSRKLFHNVVYCQYPFPAVGFTHVDANGNICGLKLRAVAQDARMKHFLAGEPGFYIVESKLLEPTPISRRLYLIEGEANANSLSEVCNKNQIPSVVISCGGVNNVPVDLPVPYSGPEYERFLMIDFDNLPDKYEKHVAKYKKLGVTPIKLILPKNEDVNSLHIKNKDYVIERLLF
jgi:hypothetical protein